jgi:colanic acid/amylovoran biosynthesis glycosyltransferase
MSSRIDELSPVRSDGRPPLPHRVAYLVSRYPALSHAFITREIAGLEDLDVQVDRFSVRPPDPAHLLTDADRREADETFVLLTQPRRHLRAHLSLLARAPAAYRRTLRAAVGRTVGRTVGGIRARVTRLGYFSEAVVLAEELRRREITHVHVHFANNGAEITRLAAQLTPVTWSVVLHSLAMHGKDHTPREDWPHRNERTWGPLVDKLRSASVVFCISEDGRTHARALLGPDDDRTRFAMVRMGVDIARFPPAAQLRRARSRDYSTILFVGRLADEKAPLALLRAGVALRHQQHDVRLVFAGDGPLRAELEAAIGQSRAQDWVRVLGAVSQEQLPELYTDADVFCLPSRVEGVPAVLMEAMSTELPVVSTGRDGIPELVRHESTGLLVHYGDPVELSAALARLIDDPDLRASLGRAGRALVSERFATHREAERLAHELMPLLGDAPPAVRTDQGR